MSHQLHHAGNRSLAAPFQPLITVSDTCKDESEQDKLTSIEGETTIDFRNHQFPVLKGLQQLSFDEYCGPTAESNWVIPNILLVGAYPASNDDEETFELLTSILNLGITKFVCLQMEYLPSAQEHVWRNGLALRPYFEDVKKLVENKHSIEELDKRKVVEINKLGFEHCPIVDCGVTDDEKVLNLCRQLVQDISKGEVIYLHCWGGHGRTGTVVSIMLHLMYGMSAFEAMIYCQAVHDLRRCPVDVGSPQTITQRNQVMRIVDRLAKSYQQRKAASSSKSGKVSNEPTQRNSASTKTNTTNLRKSFCSTSNKTQVNNSTHNRRASFTVASKTPLSTTIRSQVEAVSQIINQQCIVNSDCDDISSGEAISTVSITPLKSSTTIVAQLDTLDSSANEPQIRIQQETMEIEENNSTENVAEDSVTITLSEVVIPSAQVNQESNDNNVVDDDRIVTSKTLFPSINPIQIPTQQQPSQISSASSTPRFSRLEKTGVSKDLASEDGGALEAPEGNKSLEIRSPVPPTTSSVTASKQHASHTRWLDNKNR